MYVPGYGKLIVPWAESANPQRHLPDERSIEFIVNLPSQVFRFLGQPPQQARVIRTAQVFIQQQTESGLNEGTGIRPEGRMKVRFFQHFHALLHQGFRILPENGQVQSFLVFKVVNNGGQVHPCFRGNRPHGHSVKSPEGKKFLRGTENFTAGFRRAVRLGFADGSHRFKRSNGAAA